MLTLLGSFLGFVSSLAPEFFKVFRNKADQSHELQIMDRQMSLLKIKHSHTLEEIRSLENTAELKAIYNYPTSMGVSWVDALSGSVRPVITYAFFGIYCVIKIVHVKSFTYELDYIMQSYKASDAGSLVNHYKNVQDLIMKILGQVWMAEDQALFAAVMSFWFGQRALNKLNCK